MIGIRQASWYEKAGAYAGQLKHFFSGVVFFGKHMDRSQTYVARESGSAAIRKTRDAIRITVPQRFIQSNDARTEFQRDRFRPALDAEFGKDVGQVRGDGPGADKEILGNFGIRSTGRD